MVRTCFANVSTNRPQSENRNVGEIKDLIFFEYNKLHYLEKKSTDKARNVDHPKVGCEASFSIVRTSHLRCVKSYKSMTCTAKPYSTQLITGLALETQLWLLPMKHCKSDMLPVYLVRHQEAKGTVVDRHATYMVVSMLQWNV